MTGDQQQPAAAATPGPEQRVDVTTGTSSVTYSLSEFDVLTRRLAAIEQERDELAAIVGVECPIGDLSIVESIRVASAHAGQYAEEMQAERDALRAELAAERQRNLPLRQRIKALQDEVDQVAGPLKRRIRVAEHAADFWKRTSFQNYERWKALRAEQDELRSDMERMSADYQSALDALRAELKASQGREQALVEAIRAEDAWRDRQSMGQPRAASKTWVALRALAASTPRTDQVQAQEGHG